MKIMQKFGGDAMSNLPSDDRTLLKTSTSHAEIVNIKGGRCI